MLTLRGRSAPGRPVGCVGPQASGRNRELVEGQTVYLEKDVSETDRFDGLFHYVYLQDGRMVNELLVLEGYAQASTFLPDVNRRQSRHNRLRSLHSRRAEAAATPPIPRCASRRRPLTLIARTSPYRRFLVVRSDPHRLDGDGDGVGWEV